MGRMDGQTTKKHNASGYSCEAPEMFCVLKNSAAFVQTCEKKTFTLKTQLSLQHTPYPMSDLKDIKTVLYYHMT